MKRRGMYIILEIAHIYIEAPAEPFPSSEDFIQYLWISKRSKISHIIQLTKIQRGFDATHCMFIQ